MAVKIRYYSTKQQARTSLERIHYMLSQAGARNVMTSYDEHQRCAGIRFSLETEMGMTNFHAPCDLPRLADKLHQHWKAGEINRRLDLDLDQLERIALKGICEWLHVSISLWSTGLYSPARAMFGLLLNPSDDQPVFELALKAALLPAPAEAT